MDPNATLSQIADLLRSSAHDDEAGIELDERCQDLFDWLKSGGFPPEWAKYPSAMLYFQCRAVHHEKGERV